MRRSKLIILGGFAGFPGSAVRRVCNAWFDGSDRCSSSAGKPGKTDGFVKLTRRRLICGTITFPTSESVQPVQSVTSPHRSHFHGEVREETSGQEGCSRCQEGRTRREESCTQESSCETGSQESCPGCKESCPEKGCRWRGKDHEEARCSEEARDQASREEGTGEESSRSGSSACRRSGSGSASRGHRSSGSAAGTGSSRNTTANRRACRNSTGSPSRDVIVRKSYSPLAA